MPIVAIEDPADPRLADYRDLTDVALRKRLEPERGLYIAESAKVISRALRAGHRPRSVLIQEVWLDQVLAILPPETPLYLVSAPVAQSLTGYPVHRGALAAMHRPEPVEVSDLVRDSRRIVVLEDIVDHTNVGAIFRSCAALGVDAVLVTPRCADPLYRRSIRVSMGTVFQVPWTRASGWKHSTDILKEAGFHLTALALDQDAVPLDDFAVRAPDRLALMFGAEGDGLSRAALSHADDTVTIPMAGGVDSLNVAASAAVALWALRPTNKTHPVTTAAMAQHG